MSHSLPASPTALLLLPPSPLHFTAHHSALQWLQHFLHLHFPSSTGQPGQHKGYGYIEYDTRQSCEVSN